VAPTTRNSLKIYVLALFTLLGSLIQAQGMGTPKVFKESDVEEVELPVELLDVNSGLSQGYVHKLIQDSLGYLWISTMDGLNRFDGHRFKVYRHDAADPLSIGSDFTYTALDPQGRLIVNGHEGSLDMYDPAMDGFLHFPEVATAGKGLGGRGFLPLSVMPDGSILAHADSNRWEILLPVKGEDCRGTDCFEIMPLEKHFPGLKGLLGPDHLYGQIHVSPRGDLWFWRDDSVFWSSPVMLVQVKPMSAFANPAPKAQDPSASICLARPFFDERGRLHLFHADTLLRFAENVAAFVPMVVLPPGYNCIKSRMFTQDGRLWLVDVRSRVLRLDLSTMQAHVIRFRGSMEALEAISAVNMAFEDQMHNIWLSTAGKGCFKISARAELFKRLPARMPKYDRSHYIDRIVVPGHKALYNATLRQRWLDLSPTIEFPEPEMIIHSLNVPLTVDAKGDFWMIFLLLGNQDLGNRFDLVRMDSQTGKVRIWHSRRKNIDGELLPFLFPDHKNRIWMIGTTAAPTKAHFQCLDIASGAIQRFPIPGLGGDIPGNMIYDWYESPAGLIWVATLMGLYSLDPQTGSVHAYRPRQGDPQSLSKDYVYCVEGDPRAPERFIWVGTNGGGLNFLDRQTGKFQRITTADGLPNNVVYASLFDKHNNLWLSTNNGICLFDPVARTFRNFSKADGLAGNEFNHFEHSMSADGEMFFGGISGVNHFNPEDFYAKGKPSHIVINSLKLDNKPVEFRREADPENPGFRLTAPMETTRELVFPHDHSMIGIGFALLDLTVPGRNQYRYRLLGFNDNWIEAGNAQEAIYTNLSPGTYTFEVIGCNSRNVWNTTPATLSIVIRPPWWATWWFRILVILLVSGSIFALYNYRLQQLLKVERLRNRIGQDLHDEIGSTLSSISLYSAVMQRTSDQLPPNTINILDKIISSTSQMMESMNDMVWTIKASNDSFVQVINRMRAFAVNMTEAQEIKMTFEVDPQVEKLSLGMEQRKNVYLIYKEAVNNAAKYARCSELTIELRKVQGFLQLTITDNGIGFDPEDKSAREHLLGGNGLAGMHARGKAIDAVVEINSAAGKGTVVRVKVPL
jgi:streptogramin lyase/two-component sensor histidine kinase